MFSQLTALLGLGPGPKAGHASRGDERGEEFAVVFARQESDAETARADHPEASEGREILGEGDEVGEPAETSEYVDRSDDAGDDITRRGPIEHDTRLEGQKGIPDDSVALDHEFAQGSEFEDGRRPADRSDLPMTAEAAVAKTDRSASPLAMGTGSRGFFPAATTIATSELSKRGHVSGLSDTESHGVMAPPSTTRTDANSGTPAQSKAEPDIKSDRIPVVASRSIPAGENVAVSQALKAIQYPHAASGIHRLEAASPRDSRHSRTAARIDGNLLPGLAAGKFGKPMSFGPSKTMKHLEASASAEVPGPAQTIKNGVTAPIRLPDTQLPIFRTCAQVLTSSPRAVNPASGGHHAVAPEVQKPSGWTRLGTEPNTRIPFTEKYGALGLEKVAIEESRGKEASTAGHIRSAKVQATIEPLSTRSASEENAFGFPLKRRPVVSPTVTQGRNPTYSNRSDMSKAEGPPAAPPSKGIGRLESRSGKLNDVLKSFSSDTHLMPKSSDRLDKIDTREIRAEAEQGPRPEIAQNPSGKDVQVFLRNDLRSGSERDGNPSRETGESASVSRGVAPFSKSKGPAVPEATIALSDVSGRSAKHLLGTVHPSAEISNADRDMETDKEPLRFTDRAAPGAANSILRVQASMERSGAFVPAELDHVTASTPRQDRRDTHRLQNPPVTDNVPRVTTEARTGNATQATHPTVAQQVSVQSVISPFLADLDDHETPDGPEAALAAEPRSAATGAPGPQGASPVRPDPSFLLRQVADALPRLAEGRLDVQLNPEELGRIRFRMVQGEHGLMVHVVADRPETLDMIRRHVDQLSRDFADAGYDEAGFTFGQDSGTDRGSGGGGRPPEPMPEAEAAPAPYRNEQSASDGLDIRI